MADLIVQHVWKQENADAAFATVKSIISMAQSGKLPAGYALQSVHVVSGDHRAFCTWQAPSKGALEQLVAQVNPPTEHTVFEVQRAF
jgi:muconolactone delta-isomerase